MKKRLKNSTLRFLKLIYIKLIRINDTPQKIALGFGIGVFSGVMPGIGPFAAIFLAFLLRANRLSALLGTILTNTWVSVLTFFLSIKAGSAIMNLNYQQVCESWIKFLREFRLLNLFKVSVLKIILPVIVGYFIIAICSGLVVYLISIVILKELGKHKIKNRSKL